MCIHECEQERSAIAVCCNAVYQQTLLKLLHLISSNTPAGNCCMLMVIILHPVLDSFDLCAKCVFNKSARGDEKKESYKKILDERWDEKVFTKGWDVDSPKQLRINLLFLLVFFSPTKHSRIKIKFTAQHCELSQPWCCPLSEKECIPLIQSSSRVVIRVLYVA